MRVDSIHLTNFRSFEDTGQIRLGNITVLIGANNAGKSSILRGLALVQQQARLTPADIRVGESQAIVQIRLDSLPAGWTGSPGPGIFEVVLATQDRRGWANQSFRLRLPNEQTPSVGQIPALAPQHFVVPYLTSRKVTTYNEDVREQHAMQINDTLHFLAARLSTISNQHHPRNAAYTNACEAILGFPVTCIPSPGGQQPGVYLPDGTGLPITQLGEGVPHIVGLLAELALSKRKLFLIEEPENDLHPMALKGLLGLILKSSEENQFVISTHSNIVLTHLGAVKGTEVYEVSTPVGELPANSTIRRIEPDPRARIEVLRSLGYTLSDFDLWDGWLFLEEASAERIIRDYLIPWFTPTLTRVRTLSCDGASKVEPNFQDFYRLVRFTHLEPAYQSRTWVRVDNDTDGRAVVDSLRQNFATWPEGRFGTFDQPAFEHYYPERFQPRVAEVISIHDKRERRAAKRDMLLDVLDWIKANPVAAREAFEASAAPVIAELRAIAAELT